MLFMLIQKKKKKFPTEFLEMFLVVTKSNWVVVQG